MKLILENWRNYLTESQLLTEGRIQNAEKRFPELAKKREGLDGENLLERIGGINGSVTDADIVRRSTTCAAS